MFSSLPQIHEDSLKRFKPCRRIAQNLQVNTLPIKPQVRLRNLPNNNIDTPRPSLGQITVLLDSVGRVLDELRLGAGAVPSLDDADIKGDESAATGLSAVIDLALGICLGVDRRG
jgi:hypothetical protein